MAFALTFLGMLTIYLVSVFTLNAFTGEASERVAALYRGTEAAAELESTLSQQLAEGQSYLQSGSDETLARFDSLGAAVAGIHRRYTLLEDITPEQEARLNEILREHSTLTRDYRMVQAAIENGQAAATRQRAAELSAAGEHIRLLIRQLTVTANDIAEIPFEVVVQSMGKRRARATAHLAWWNS